MSGNSHYEILGVNENSSFDEIQEARNILLEEKGGDRKQTEAIEAAYDAILMDRLRLRQEGKIKVPERIRFPERLVEPPPDFAPVPPQQAPGWLKNLFDRPVLSDLALPGGLFLGMGALSLLLGSPTVPLALGVGLSLYFLNRKEKKFLRAFLLTLGGLVVGCFVGMQIGGLLASQLAAIPIALETFAAGVALLVLWLVSSFLR
jgi:Protein CHAPERONE-LIKE PROTEIN OF POR1-like